VDHDGVDVSEAKLDEDVDEVDSVKDRNGGKGTPISSKRWCMAGCRRIVGSSGRNTLMFRRWIELLPKGFISRSDRCGCTSSAGIGPWYPVKYCFLNSSGVKSLKRLEPKTGVLVSGQGPCRSFFLTVLYMKCMYGKQ
jgi:hypothetical protein